MLTVGDAAPGMKLHPVFGLPVDLSHGTTVVAFLRPLTGCTARVQITTLTEAFPRFDAEAIRVVGVTRTDLTYARDFVPRYHVLFPIYVDETGEVFRAFQVGADKGLAKTLTTLPTRLGTAVEALKLGRTWNVLPSSDLPAWFVVRDGRVAYASYGSSAMDQPDIEELWRAATG